MLRLQLQRPVIPLPTAGMGVAAAIPTEVPVFIDPRRAAGAKAAVAAGADVLVMDDGFQHLRLKRDLDIVLVDATCPLGFDHVLPRGLLREPLTALAAADAVVITHADMLDAAGLKALRSRLAELAPQATVHDASHQPTHLVDEVGNRRELSDLANKKVVAFCGLGNPGQFFGMLRHQSLGIDVANTLAFDDHAAYGPGELGQLDRLAGQCDAEVLVTTQKDAVKLPPHWSSRPVWALAMEMEITQGREALLARIDGVLRRP
jgi:tetraacyldisaccharide 4'-kinase